MRAHLRSALRWGRQVHSRAAGNPGLACIAGLRLSLCGVVRCKKYPQLMVARGPSAPAWPLDSQERCSQVVTQGAHGCTAYRDSMAPVHVPSRPASRLVLFAAIEVTTTCHQGVVDATGAGDAFVAGFLSSWLLQSSPKQSDAEHKASFQEGLGYLSC